MNYKNMELKFVKSFFIVTIILNALSLIYSVFRALVLYFSVISSNTIIFYFRMFLNLADLVYFILSLKALFYFLKVKEFKRYLIFPISYFVIGFSYILVVLLRGKLNISDMTLGIGLDIFSVLSSLFFLIYGIILFNKIDSDKN
jgi:hypothetical protein